MHFIELDGASWQSRDDFYSALLSRLGAPDWHGRNFDALNDTLRGGDINAVNPPITFVVTGIDTMGREARHTVTRFGELISDLRAEGVPVSVEWH
jgi:RNAse (barnase) inhibitor barstar